MKKLSSERLADVIKQSRKKLDYSQERLGELTHINRIMIGKIEKGSFIPSIIQLESLASCLGFEIESLFVEDQKSSSFVALRSEALSDSEREGFDTLVSMMLSLRKQIVLRRTLDNES